MEVPSWNDWFSIRLNDSIWFASQACRNTPSLAVKNFAAEGADSISLKKEHQKDKKQNHKYIQGECSSKNV